MHTKPLTYLNQTHMHTYIYYTTNNEAEVWHVRQICHAFGNLILPDICILWIKFAKFYATKLPIDFYVVSSNFIAMPNFHRLSYMHTYIQVHRQMDEHMYKYTDKQVSIRTSTQTNR